MLLPEDLKRRVDAVCQSTGLKKSAFWNLAVEKLTAEIEQNGYIVPATGTSTSKTNP